MTALTAASSVRRSALARPTASERLLLRLSSALESAAIARMQRRAASVDARARSASASRTRGAAAERRRDAAAVAHVGLLPR